MGETCNRCGLRASTKILGCRTSDSLCRESVAAFNDEDASLGYLREWILRNARMLARIDLHPDLFQLQRKPKELIDVETTANKQRLSRLRGRQSCRPPYARDKTEFRIEKGMSALRKSNSWSRSGATERPYRSASLPERKWLWVLLIRRHTLRG